MDPLRYHRARDISRARQAAEGRERDRLAALNAVRDRLADGDRAAYRAAVDVLLETAVAMARDLSALERRLIELEHP